MGGFCLLVELHQSRDCAGRAACIAGLLSEGSQTPSHPACLFYSWNKGYFYIYYRMAALTFTAHPPSLEFCGSLKSCFLVKVPCLMSKERQQSSSTARRVAVKAFSDLKVPILSPSLLTASSAGSLTINNLVTTCSTILYRVGFLTVAPLKSISTRSCVNWRQISWGARDCKNYCNWTILGATV